MIENDARYLERLRKKAEKKVQERHGEAGREFSGEEVDEIVHELHVYQTELELQNDTLQKIKSRLDESTKRYFDLFDLAPIGYAVLGEDMTIEEANLTFTEMVGSDVKAVVKKKLTQFVAEGSQDELYFHVRRVLEIGHQQSSEIMFRTGAQINARIVSIPVEEKGRTSILSALLDITEAKRAQQKVEEHLISLRRSNDELQQFAYVASHDLREPLRMVSSYLDLLEKKYEGKVLDLKAKEYIRFAVDGADRMKGMIDDLLIYSRIETGATPREPVDMDEALATALKDLKVSIEESGAVVTHDRLPTATADRMQVLLLLENLLSNAVKFHSAAAPRIHISVRQSGLEGVFSVADNGIGIDPKQQDRLFRMFSRLHTREEYEGTGIGLAICKKIVERHGGRIWLEPGVGKGSTFFFTLPLWRSDGPEI